MADRAWTPLAFAVAYGKVDAVRDLLDRGANPNVRDSAGHTLAELARARGHEDVAALLERSPTTSSPTPTDVDFGRRVADFLLMACGDWRVAGSQRQLQARDAHRLLDREPDIAGANVHTAVVCGQLDLVRRMLDEVPARVSGLGGPRGWPPILYLCSSRLPLDAATAAAPAMLRLLLERGADPNAFYLGGSADIHYTALTCVLGRGEEIGPMHPRARDLAAILLEAGADPHDNQVLYNVFADNTSRHLLTDDIVWLLDLMYEHSIRRGHAADWADPAWPMFDMRGAPSPGDDERVHHGARLLLEAAVDRNLLGMAEWLLARGAGPNLPRGELWRNSPRLTLYQEALARGHTGMAELLARYGADRTPPVREGVDAFVDTCLTLDRQRARELLSRNPQYLDDHRPMFAIIQRDRADALALLLDLGASPDTENPHSGRMRALHIAAAADATECAKLLIERGAGIDPVDTSFNSTPIGWASWYANTRMMELLSHHTRNVWALVYRGFTGRLRELLSESPELSRSVNDEGQTPLFWLPADDAGALEIVELLLDHGADPATRDSHGRTAADVALRRGFDNVVERLRQAERDR